MTTSQYLLNVGLLAFVLISNIGTHPFTRRRITLPIVLVAIAGFAFLKDMPTLGNDGQLELVGAASGVALGVIAALFVGIQKESDGTLTARAGSAFAAVWIIVIGGRILFAYGAEHWFSNSLARFSRAHQITGSDAWTSAFVLMALSMVLTRVLVNGAQAARMSARQVPALSR